MEGPARFQVLTTHGDSAQLPAVHIPPALELRAALEPVFAANASGQRFFCGADLEEAVNRTYQNCLRKALGDKWPEDYGGVEVYLTTEALGHSLNDVPRSVTEDAIDHFINDVNRFCGAHTAARITERLCPES